MTSDNPHDVQDDQVVDRLKKDICIRVTASSSSYMKITLMAMMMAMMTMTTMMMVTQHIPNSQIPTRWESDIMILGGNMTQSNSHYTHVHMSILIF